jgi:thiol-disulfide isomerase/thioredoxin
VPATVYESSPYTVVLFARSSCGACKSAKPLFKKLVANIERRSSARVVMIAPMANRQDEVTYAKELGLDETQLLQLDLKDLRLRRVPTVVLLDQRGIVRYTREGAPLAADQEEFLQGIASLIPDR